MQAIEFCAAVENGQLTLPEELQKLERQQVRVIVLIEQDLQEQHEVRLFANHAANQIKEWQGSAEDEVWT